MRKLLFFLFIPLLSYSQNGIQDSTLAFPGAMGGGANATGGKGGVLYIVDNLGRNTSDQVYHPVNCNIGGHSHTLPLGNADVFYTGGFFSAVEIPEVGHIVLNVSGNIELQHGTSSAGGTTIMGFGYDGINMQNKTIYGQSAPRGGITFTGGLLKIGGYTTNEGDNNIIRYIRSRPIYNKAGVITDVDDASTWALLLNGGDDVIVDHCSFTWAQDKAAGSYIREENVAGGSTMYGQTWSYNIVGDSNTSAYTAINPNREGDPEEYVDRISWLRNIMIASNRTPNMTFDGDGEVYNNIIYNIPYKYSRVYHDIRLNHRGNYYLEYGTTYEFNWAGTVEGADIPIVHSSGNYMVGTVSRDEYTYSANFTGNLSTDNRELWTQDGASPDRILDLTYYTFTPHDFSVWSNTVLTTPQIAYTDLITNGNVGANRYIDNDGYVQIYQDDIDLTMIAAISNRTNYVRNVNNWVLPSTPNNTRPSSYDSDWDGMSDAWEIRVYGNLDQSYRGDFDGDGVDNITEQMIQVDTGNSSTITSGYTATPQSGLQTTENGGTANVSVVLNTQPTTDVVFDVVSDDTSEGTVSPSTLTFTNANWNIGQNVTITGVDDAIDDGNINYTVTVSVDDALSDNNYDGLPDTNVSVTNIDNDISSETGSGNTKILKSNFTLIHN